MEKRRMTHPGRMLWRLLVLACLVIPGAVQATTYSVLDLGGLVEGNASIAFALNEEGSIAGVAYNALNKGRAVVWKEGGIRDLGTLGGESSQASGINARGDVCGTAQDADGIKRAFLFKEGSMVSLQLGKEKSEAYGINASGQVVGYFYENRKKVGFSWADGELSVFDGFSDYRLSQCYGVNDNGEIAGWLWPQDRGEQGFFWSGSRMTLLGDLGSGPKPKSKAVALNSKGHLVGHAYSPDKKTYRPFLWDGSTLTDIGEFPEAMGERGEALGLNDSDHVVGLAKTSAGETHAFLYDGTTFLDLNQAIDPDTPWILTHARGINNKGWIVGSGNYEGQQGHRAFLLKPRGPKWSGLKGVVTARIASGSAVLKGAVVAISGTGLQAVTNARGQFLIENLPKGVYEVTLSMNGFLRQTIKNVTIAEGECTTLSHEACAMVLHSRSPDADGDGDVDMVDTMKVLKVLTGE